MSLTATMSIMSAKLKRKGAEQVSISTSKSTAVLFPSAIYNQSQHRVISEQVWKQKPSGSMSLKTVGIGSFCQVSEEMNFLAVCPIPGRNWQTCSSSFDLSN